MREMPTKPRRRGAEQGALMVSAPRFAKEIQLKSTFAIGLLSAAMLTACGRDADIASRNLSTAADQFEITRRIVFYNGITGDYMMTLEGLCALGNNDSARQLTVTCKTGQADYKKHFLGLSDNVTYFVEQVDSAPVGVYHYRVIFKPQSIIPNIDFKGSTTGN